MAETNASANDALVARDSGKSYLNFFRSARRFGSLQKANASHLETRKFRKEKTPLILSDWDETDGFVALDLSSAGKYYRTR